MGKAVTDQLLSIMVILNVVVKEVIATLTLVTTSIAMAVLVHFAILMFLSCRVIHKVTSHIIVILVPIVSLGTEVLFHCLGVAVALPIALISYTFIFSLLCCHALYTVGKRLKQSKRRKRYFRRLLKVVTYVGFVLCLTYVVREKTSVVMETTGKTTFTLALGYMISGRPSTTST